MVIKNKNDDNAKKEILEVLSILGLKTFNDQSFYEYIETLNHEANEIFEFENYSDDYFKKRFIL